MSAQHTPGPWDYDQTGDDKRICVGIGLVEGPNGYDVAEVYSDDCDHDEALANARLIAAAPDLLDAVRELEAILAEGLFNIEPDRISRAREAGRAAISKATGAS